MSEHSEVIITPLTRLRDGQGIGILGAVEGVPMAILEAWTITLSQLRFLHDAATATNRSHERILQGRLEGIGIVWHLMSGDADDSDDRLQAAVAKYQELGFPEEQL